ncbi:MAG: DUF4175 domain-containing protein [Chitinophagales bacterium]|nr:DUF4175 domain-containing protein [Chitinophagales bacterium]
MSNYQLLIHKLDAFIKKYYLNQLIRGSLLFVSLILAYYLFAIVSEYNLYFSTTVRKLILFGFFGLFTVSFYFWVLQPLMRYWSIGQQISHNQAAGIIGTHFANVKDKLLNILQLNHQSQNAYNRDLIEASINQKTDAIKLVPFGNAIQLDENKKYLKYLFSVLLLLIAIAIIAPNIFKESNKRLANPNVVFEKEAPFQFILKNKNLKAVQFEDLELKLSIEGKTIPNEVFIQQDGQSYKMEKLSATEFSYKFSNVQDNFNFNFLANDFTSNQHTVEVLKKPLIVNFKTQLNYPSYTQKKDEVLSNSGDAVVPEGTVVSWLFESSNADNVYIIINNKKYTAKQNGKNEYSFSANVKTDIAYTVVVSNAAVPKGDSVKFNISATPDQYPSIQAAQIVDSSNLDFVLLSGAVSDDYGLSKLAFVYSIVDENGKIITTKSRPLPLNGKSISDFNYTINLNSFDLKAGQQINYIIQVWDNDAVNGAKSSKSQVYQYKKKSIDELEKQEYNNNEEIKDELAAAQQSVNKLSKQIKEMQQKLLNKNELSWEDKKQIEQLQKEHQQLVKELKEIQDKYAQNLENQKEFKKENEEILEKQEKIQEMLNDVMNDEMKDLMKQIEALMEKMKQKDAFQELKKMDMSSDNLNKELEKMQDLFKQLQLEQKAQETIDKLNELAKEQNQLSDDTKKSDKSSEQLQKEQKEIQQKFDGIKEDLKQLEQFNKENNSPMNLSKQDDQAKDIDKKIQNSQQQLQQNQKNGASQQQKNAGEKMEEMAEQLQEGLDKMQSDQNAEDIKLVRQLLENLMKLSFDQEQVMNTLKKTNAQSPKYVELMQEQANLRADANMIADSLHELGKRQFDLQSFISDEVYKLKREMQKSLDFMQERYVPQTSTAQQFVMTSTNNLALMLSESLDNLQKKRNQMQQKMSGNGSCDKPGGEGQKPSLQEMQKGLGDKMKEMMDKQKNGEGQNGKQMSKDFAEALEKQQAIRDALQKLKEQMSEQQKKGSGVDGLMDKMEEVEKDLMKKNLTNQTLMRQKEIETRLLEFDKAKREQGEEDKRQSNSGEDKPAKLPAGLQEYLDKKQSTIEMYKTVPPNLKPFYKKLVDKYFQTVK